MRVMGLDVGTKRIGVAVSDPLGITAQALTTIVKENSEKTYKALEDIIREKEITKIVVGLPINMDGSEGPKAKEARLFADSLKEKFNIIVNMQDERLSTLEVEKRMIEADASRAKRKRKVDKLAAQLILQGYLDQNKNKSL